MVRMDPPQVDLGVVPRLLGAVAWVVVDVVDAWVL